MSLKFSSYLFYVRSVIAMYYMTNDSKREEPTAYRRKKEAERKFIDLELCGIGTGMMQTVDLCWAKLM